MIFTLYVVISTSARGRMTPGMSRCPGAPERGCVPLGAGSAVARPHRMAPRIRNRARRSGGRCCGWLSRHTALRNALPRGGTDHLRSSVNVRFLTMNPCPCVLPIRKHLPTDELPGNPTPRIIENQGTKPRDRRVKNFAVNINSLNYFGVKSVFPIRLSLVTCLPGLTQNLGGVRWKNELFDEN